MIETLIGKGFDLSLYDPNVLISKLIGKNKDYLTGHIPHISSLLKDSVDEVVSDAELIIIGNRSTSADEIFSNLRDDQIVIDLVRIIKGKVSEDNYVGICW